MRTLLLAALASSLPLVAEALPSRESLMSGCGFDGAKCAGQASAVRVSNSVTDDYIMGEIDKVSGLSGPTLRGARKGEAELIQRTIDESPVLQRAMSRKRSWSEYYQDRNTDAAVASWGSNLKAGYLMGTAAAYATYKTAPPVVDVVAGAVLWTGGVVVGLVLSAVAMAFTGHL